jgi:hypothetical protein
MKCTWLILLFLSALACGTLVPAIETTQIITPTSTNFPTPTAQTDPTTYGNISIAGTPEFISQTRAALALLEQKDGEAFQKIQTYIGIIWQGEHSGMWVWEVPPRYEVGDATAFYSVTWYASTIAHDATHSELYQQYALAHPGEVVPEQVYASVEVEQFCNGYQLEVLKRIGAPQSEIDYMSTLDGTHCDVDEDGDCDWVDYQNRDW